MVAGSSPARGASDFKDLAQKSSDRWLTDHGTGQDLGDISASLAEPAL
jgi:hypothetical protein